MLLQQFGLKLRMSRFATVDEEKRATLLKETNSECTHKATSVSWNAFQSYLREKGIDVNPSTATKKELNNILKSFYVEVRKVDGSSYKKSSLIGIRHGLQRKIKEF